MREGHEAKSAKDLRDALWQRTWGGVVRLRWPLVAVYALGAGLSCGCWLRGSARRSFPPSDARSISDCASAPTGTRIERTELIALKALDVIKQEVGPDNVEISTAFIGVQPASYPINTIYLWTSGPQEAVMLVALKPGCARSGEALRERLRAALPTRDAGRASSLRGRRHHQPGDELRLADAHRGRRTGPSIAANRAYAEKVRSATWKLKFLARSGICAAVRLSDRGRRSRSRARRPVRADCCECGASLVAATSSSRSSSRTIGAIR